MKKKMKASMTVEAALLYPYLLLITCLLVKLTVHQYIAVKGQATAFYDAVFTEQGTETAELLRAADVAFDFFEKK